MADLNRPADSGSFLEEPKKMPAMINTLTILTFIGSGVLLIFGVWGFIGAPENYRRVSSMNLDALPSFARKMMGANPVETARIALENRVPNLLMALLMAGACIYGAIWMRQLKKNGFYIYLIGEIVLPILAAALFAAPDTLTSSTAIFGYCLAILFIVLYATQLKYMK